MRFRKLKIVLISSFVVLAVVLAIVVLQKLLEKNSGGIRNIIDNLVDNQETATVDAFLLSVTEHIREILSTDNYIVLCGAALPL